MTPIESLNYKEQGKSPGLVSFYSLPFPIFISGYWSFRPPYSSEGCSGFAPASLLSIRYTLFYVRYSISYSLPASTLFVNYFLSLWKQYLQLKRQQFHAYMKSLPLGLSFGNNLFYCDQPPIWQCNAVFFWIIFWNAFICSSDGLLASPIVF